MTNVYSDTSRERLATCHPDLQRLFTAVLEVADHAIICGHRNKADQDAAFVLKRSRHQWPNGKHNQMPSVAIDAAPVPIKWSDTERFKVFARAVLAMAEKLGIPIIWGGDWDRDGDTTDQTFNDLVHFELVLASTSSK